MSSKGTTQAQQDAFGGWNQMVKQQIEQLESVMGEVTKLQKRGIERTSEAIDELAKLSHAAVQYGAELTERWQEMALTIAKTASGPVAK